MIATKTTIRTASFFTTCQRCGYIVNEEEETCDACKKQIQSNHPSNLFLW